MKWLVLITTLLFPPQIPVRTIHVEIPYIQYTIPPEVQGCNSDKVTTSSEVYLETSGRMGSEGDYEGLQGSGESEICGETTND